MRSGYKMHQATIEGSAALTPQQKWFMKLLVMAEGDIESCAEVLKYCADAEKVTSSCYQDIS